MPIRGRTSENSLWWPTEKQRSSKPTPRPPAIGGYGEKGAPEPAQVRGRVAGEKLTLVMSRPRLLRWFGWGSGMERQRSWTTGLLLLGIFAGPPLLFSLYFCFSGLSQWPDP